MNNKKYTLIGLNSGIFWGLSTVILGISLVSLENFGNQASLTATLLHDTSSAVLMLVLLVLMGKFRQFLEVLKTKSGALIMLAALLGGPLGMGSYLLSINYLGAPIAASISAIYPAFGALLAFLILKEKISKKQVIGLLISVSAIMLMSMSANLTVKNLPLGLFTIFLCILGWGSEAVIVGYAMNEEVESEIALSIRQCTSALVYSFLILPMIGFDSLNYIVGSFNIVLPIILAGIFGTISYLSYYKAIDGIGATKAMALNITYPAWAFFFQLLVSGQFNFTEFILVLLILLGTFVGIDRKTW